MKTKNTLIPLISPLLVLAFCNSAIAGITRKCNAYYRIKIVRERYHYGIVGKPFTITDTLHSSSPLGLFKVIGGCGNKFVANRCRRRARNKAHDCMSSHWRSAESRPASCMTNSIKNYSISNLRVFLEDQVRSEYKQYLYSNPKVNVSAIQVWAVTTGNDSCDKKKILGNVPKYIWKPTRDKLR